MAIQNIKFRGLYPSRAHGLRHPRPKKDISDLIRENVMSEHGQSGFHESLSRMKSIFVFFPTSMTFRYLQ